MATTTAAADSNHHSPRGGSSGDGGLSSPSQLRRKNFPSPWAQVVRGGGEAESVAGAYSPSSSPPPPTSLNESANSSSPSKAASASSSSSPPPLDNSTVAAPESSDANDANAVRPKKPAWNRLSNGVVEVGPVMGAVSWPALSESTKPSPKSSIAESSSSKAVSDGSVPSNQVPVISHVPQKQPTTNANPNSNPNRTMPARQRLKRGGGISNAGGGPGQSGFARPSQPPPPPPFPLFPVAPNNFRNPVPALPDPSPREPLYRGNNWETRPVGGFGSQSHGGSDRNSSSRRGNYGPRGNDGPYHNNFGGRRDQDRGNYANSRDVHVQPHRGPPRGFVRPPPPNAATFVPPPQHMRPFANPMGYPEYILIPPMPMDHFRNVTYIPPAPPAAMFVPVAEPPLPAQIVVQIEYYFSDANLIKDEYLKSNMDDQGWVPITLIAGFPRVKSLTSNIQFILDSLKASTLVEVQDDKVRRRSEWKKWIPSGKLATDSSFPSLGGSTHDMLTTSFQKMTVEEGTVKAKANSSEHASSGNSQLPNGEGTEDAYSNQN